MHRYLKPALAGMIAVLAFTQTRADPLADYVNTIDPEYDYQIVSRTETSPVGGFIGDLLGDRLSITTTYVLNMVSQRWRDETEVDQPVWEHEVVVSVPRLRDGNTALLIVSGSSNPPSMDTELSRDIELALNALGIIGVLVKQIPNQPLSFTDEVDRPRREDEILAYSMDKYLLTEDPTWPVHVAMTKAAVRAMDTAQDLLLREEGIAIEDFIVLGGSKRGWTTWLAAAVDDRIRGIIPASIDLLNINRQFPHHWGAYGFYAPAIQDYTDFDIACRVRGREGRKLLDIIDPHAYRDRYEGLPKLLLNSTGDQFFLLDSSQFYYDELPLPKAMRYSVNTDHSQDDSVIRTALDWIDDVRDGDSGDGEARYTWRFEEDGSIRVETFRTPDRIRLWQAYNPDARDFRLETLGAAWTATDLGPAPDGSYIAFVEPPEQGWSAFLVEVTYNPSGFIEQQLGLEQRLTTDVRVVPDTLPYADSFCEDWLRLFNVSTRGPVGTGENTLRAGFIVDGPADSGKRFLVKAEGAILNRDDVVADPYVRVYDLHTGVEVAFNDNWIDSPDVEAIAEYAPPASELEAALLVELPPGAYIAEMGGNDGGTGLGLVAVTEFDQSQRDPGLINISTRGQVGTGENTLRTGFIIDGGAGSRRLLIKGEGPILGLPGVLADPRLRLSNFFTGEVIETNDNWRDHPSAAEVEALAPPASDREAAFVIELPPGVYIAELSGVDGGTGLGLVAVTETSAFEP